MGSSVMPHLGLIVSLYLLSVCDRMTEPNAVNPAKFALICDVVNRQVTELIRLHAEVASQRQIIQEHRSCWAWQAPMWDHSAPQQPFTRPVGLRPSRVASHSTPPTPHPQLSLREKFNDLDGNCDVRFTTLYMIFECQPSRYNTDCQQITLLSSLFTGQAAERATAILHSDCPLVPGIHSPTPPHI